jgi:hypothetical protein
MTPNPSRRLRVAAAIATFALYAPGGHAERPEQAPSGEEPPGSISFTATVRSVELMSRFQGQAILADLDPRFVIVLEVDERGSGDAAIPAGGRVAFAVHSPTFVFARAGGADGRVGQTLQFTVEKTEEAGVTRWRRLLAEKRLKE